MNPDPIMLEITQPDITKIFEESPLLWNRPRPEGMFGLPYRLERGDLQYYAGVSREDYPTLRAPVIDTPGAAVSVELLDKFSAQLREDEKRRALNDNLYEAAMRPKERTMNPEHKDLIIELMAEEIQRLRSTIAERNGHIQRLMHDASQEANKSLDLRRRLDEAVMARVRAENEVQTLTLANVHRGKAIDRLEAALAKCRKSSKKKA